MVSLPWATWERLVIWMALGFVVYFLYSRQRAQARRWAGGGGTAPRGDGGTDRRVSEVFVALSDLLLGLTLGLAGLLGRRGLARHPLPPGDRRARPARLRHRGGVGVALRQPTSSSSARGPRARRRWPGARPPRPTTRCPSAAALSPAADSLLPCGPHGDSARFTFALDLRTGALDDRRRRAAAGAPRLAGRYGRGRGARHSASAPGDTGPSGRRRRQPAPGRWPSTRSRRCGTTATPRTTRRSPRTGW